MSKTICFCNSVSEESILVAIRNGAQNLDQIYDKTSAGAGPCGGTCRNNILSILANSIPDAEKAPHPEKPSWNPPLEVTQAISLFNRRYYWEAHEILEELWIVETGSTKLFYQGIIQAAAAFYHVLNDNPKGVIKLAGDSRTKLMTLLPAYKSIPLDDLVKKLEDFSTQAREILGGTRSGFEYDQLPQLTIQP